MVAILSRNHGQRYYGWEIKEGKFHYFEYPNLEREKAYEGEYLIQTEEQGLTPVEVVEAYKDLSDVEMAFRSLKDVIEMGPIYHGDDGRVKGPIFVAALAFLLERAMEKKLKAAGSNLSGEAALEALRTIHVVEMEERGILNVFSDPFVKHELGTNIPKIAFAIVWEIQRLYNW